jgi:hypothetical protein
MQTRWASFLLQCRSLLLCRFSDAGDDELATRSGSRHPKSAKARNRGRYAPWPCRRLSYGGLSSERAACMPARGERWSDCAGRSMPAGSRWSPRGQTREARAVICGTSKEFVQVDARSSERRGRKRRHPSGARANTPRGWPSNMPVVRALNSYREASRNLMSSDLGSVSTVNRVLGGSSVMRSPGRVERGSRS